MATGLAMIAMADAALTAAAHGWALSASVTTAGTGLGLSSVAATTLGTTVPDTLRGTASGIINTAAQLGTATGIALVLLIAAATTGLPAPGGGGPITAWAAAAAIAAAGTLAFTSTSLRPNPWVTCPALRPTQTRSLNPHPGKSVPLPPRATPTGEQDATIHGDRT